VPSWRRRPAAPGADEATTASWATRRTRPQRAAPSTSHASPLCTQAEGDCPSEHEATREGHPQPQQPGRAGDRRRQHQGGQRQEGQQRPQPRDREVATVPRADQHAVEDEDPARQRLGERDDDQHGRQRRLHLLLRAEQRRQQLPAGQQQCPEDDPGTDAPRHHPPGQRTGGLGVACTQGSPRQRLRRDGDRVERQREEPPERRRHLVRRERGVALGHRDVRRDEQRRPQRERAGEQRHADDADPHDAAGVGPQ
jgi:hypothetical protein